METHRHPDKNRSFSRNENASIPVLISSPTSPHSFTTSTDTTTSSTSDPNSRRDSAETDKKSFDDKDDNFSSSNVRNVSHHIDEITDILNSTDDKSNPPDVQDAVETISKIIESRIAKYDLECENPARKRSANKMSEEDSFFIEAVIRISKLNKAISEFPPASSATSGTLLNRTGTVLQGAMAFLEDDLRALLDKANPVDTFCRFSSFNRNDKKKPAAATVDEEDDIGASMNKELSEYYYPGYSQEIITKMSRIVSAMILSGYEAECCQVYALSRRTTFHEQLKKMDYEKINVDDIWKMNWDCLETEIKRWIKVVRNCSRIIFPGEKQLILSVFSSHPSASGAIFNDFARNEVLRLLDFAGAVSMTKRGSEKLFKILDMYEALRDLILEMTIADPPCPEKLEEYCCWEQKLEPIRTEIAEARDRIGEAAVNIVSDLQNSIKCEANKSPVPGGAIHPLTRYVMNYMNNTCEYKDTLEQIFEYHGRSEQSPGSTPTNNSSSQMSTINNIESDGESPHHSDLIPATTPHFSKQMIRVIDNLDSNLESKSWMYKDISLRYVFLMNNGRYILQKVRGSVELHEVMGDNWCRRRSTVVRQFHKNYQRETWVRLLHALSHEGILLNGGKVNKSLLKERFKNFNSMFEDIHKTQSAWVVSDEQLQSELRIAISAVVIPAYRSFLGRFKQYFESSKQVEKYIKYQPEDIETLVEGLFEGISNSMARRRT